MSQVVSTFRSALRTALGAPGHALLVFVMMLLGAVVGGVLSLVPLVGPLVNGVVVAPALLAVVVGGAHSVREGGGAFDGATTAVKRAGTSVMGAYALLVAGYVAVSLVLTFVFVGLLFAVGGGMQPGTELSALSGAVGVLAVVLFLAVFVVLLAVAMTIQFVAPAAVVADTGAVESLATSYRFVRRNLLGVTGLSLVLVGLGVAAFVAVLVLFAVGRALEPGVGIALAAVGYLLAVTFVGSVTAVYQVGYFATVVASADLPDGHELDDSTGDTGAFVVGDVSQASAADEGDSVTSRDPETGRFHVEMAGENDAPGRTGDDETDENEAAADETGWEFDSDER